MNRISKVAVTLASTLALGAGFVGATAAQAATTSDGQTYTLDRTIRDSRVTESSGLARSTYAGSTTMYTHNDSGDTNRIFAIDGTGATRSVITVAGAKANDWEDIAAGPNHSLYIGDIGDNNKRRPNVQVYKIAELAALAPAQTVTATKYDFTYPDGAHNAEALMVHPISGRIYLVTKSTTGGNFYEAPATLSTTSTNVLKKVGLPVTLKISAAAFTPNGKGFVIQNYSTAFVYSSVNSAPIVLKRPATKMGESVEINAAGTHMLFGSEGTPSPVYAMALPLGAWVGPAL